MSARLAIVAAIALAAPLAHAAGHADSQGSAELIAGDDCKKAPKPNSKYRRYCRPALFHPTTALAEFRLRAEREKSTRAIPKDRAEELSARIAKLEAASTAAPPEPVLEPPVTAALYVQAPGVLANDVPAYDVLITDDCPDGKSPIVVVDPSNAAKPLAKIEGKQFKLVIETARLSAVHSVHLSVVSCQAFGLTRAQAEEKQQVHEVEIPVSGFFVNTRLNVWARQDVAEEFGQEFSGTFIVADAVVENTRDRPILVYGSSLTARVRFLMALPDVRTKFGDWPIQHPDTLWKVSYGGERPLADALDFMDTYRPLSFSDILAIFSYKREADPRQRTISALKSLGTLLTAGSVFGVGQDYLQGVTFFTGAFVPELEKQLMWDMLLHVKNLEQRSFKEVEEIPARGQLRKVVFFPRRPIEGIVPFAPMYIAEIGPDELKLSGVVLEQTNPLQGAGTKDPKSTAPQ